MKNTKVGKVNRKRIRKKKLGTVYLKKAIKWHGTESKQKSRCGWKSDGESLQKASFYRAES